MKTFRKILKVILYNFILYIILAFVYLICFYATLPPTDGARQSGLLFFIDPFVWTVILLAGAKINLSASIYMFCLFRQEEMNMAYISLLLCLLPIVSIITLLTTTLNAIIISCFCAIFFSIVIKIILYFTRKQNCVNQGSNTEQPSTDADSI